ncbi:MAG: efflux RND transporter periplasmic adaptor subunit [Pseudomonadota bacterium]|nr:efflux RND transporter periplasmic adaptor subunit [Pseudomonadota bacterium]
MALPRARRMRYGMILIILVALATAAWWWLKPAEKPTEHLTAPVTRMDLENTVLASGKLEARRLVSVGAQASGRVERVFVELGDEVSRGQLVAQIDNLTQQNALQNAQAALANQQAQRLVRQAQLEQNRQSLARQKALLADQATSQAEYEAAEAAFKTAQAEITALDAQLRQAQLSVDTAKLNVGYSRVTAPMAGTVVAIVTEEGQTVNANQSAPTIIRVADLQTLTVKAQISEADVVRVKAGQTVYFTILGDPDKRYYATLRSIEPAPESIRTENASTTSTNTAIYYNGLFDVPNPDGELRIDMTAQVYIVLDEAKNALTVPAAALSKGKGGISKVRVLGADGQPVEREVKVGLNNRVDAQILSGVQEGEKVILGGASGIQSQSRGGRRGMGF